MVRETGMKLKMKRTDSHRQTDRGTCFPKSPQAADRNPALPAAPNASTKKGISHSSPQGVVCVWGEWVGRHIYWFLGFVSKLESPRLKKIHILLPHLLKKYIVYC